MLLTFVGLNILNFIFYKVKLKKKKISFQHLSRSILNPKDDFFYFRLIYKA